MKRILLPFTLLLSAIFFCTSCLNSDEETIVYYQDTAISAFSLGNLNRYVVGKSKDGKRDSTYKSTVTGSNYRFYIDQEKREIYNPDSLPYGTDNKHVICNITSKNSGVITIKNIDSDTLKYYVSTDSLNFEVPREIRVFPYYMTDTTLYRKYTVRVNVHKEYADSFTWNLKCVNSDFAGLRKTRTVVCNDNVFVFGTDGSKTKVFRTSAADGSNWTALGCEFDAEAYKNIAVKDSYIYIMCGNGKLLRSSDSETWDEVADNVAFDRLVGAGTKKLYAFAGGNKIMVSEDDGKTWAEDKMEDTSSVLPAGDVSLNVMPLKTNNNAERIIVTGYSTDGNQTEKAVVWSKIEEYADCSETHSWICYDNGGDDRFALPSLEGTDVLVYDGVLIALGASKADDSETGSFSTIYMSEDNGLTWHSSNKYVYPSNIDRSATTVSAAVDDSNHLWIICGVTGQVWCGRLNRLGWER